MQNKYAWKQIYLERMKMKNAIRLGIAGLGTVGSDLIRLLENRGKSAFQNFGVEFSIHGVTAKNRHRNRGINLDPYNWHEDPVALASAQDIDIFVELIGGESGIVEESVRAALASGKHVVTANKALLARHGVELAKLAEENSVQLHYEGAVGGGIPIVKAMRESLISDQVSRVSGILNGTCNYILTRMEAEELSFSECLDDAQQKGYAEADPTFDIAGHDTAHKLALLTSMAFGTEIASDSIYIEGISSITLEDIKAAKELGYRIKLLGVAQHTETGIEQRVHPTMIAYENSLANISGVTNAITVDTDKLGSVTLSGPGAGGEATASAVFADIVEVARGHKSFPLGIPIAQLLPYERARMRSHEGGYYIRLSVDDRLGAFAAIATRMAEAGISLASIVQKENVQKEQDEAEQDTKTVILITHETTESTIHEALNHIRNDGHIKGKPQLIRIEKN